MNLTLTGTKRPCRANLTWLTKGLATGGDLSWDPKLRALQIADILDSGITHIIDMRMEDDDAELWASMGIEYINLGTDDIDGWHVPADLFNKGVEFAREAKRAGGKVLAHCHMGINRGPSMAAAILMDRGMAPSTALRLIRTKRPISGVHYFMDAYDAHVERSGRKADWQVRKFLHSQWYAAVGNPTATKHIKAACRAGHLEDARARVAKREAERFAQYTGRRAQDQLVAVPGSLAWEDQQAEDNEWYASVLREAN